MGGLFSSGRTTQPTPSYAVPPSAWPKRQTTANFTYHSYRVPAAERERPVIRPTPQIHDVHAIPCVPANRSLRNIILQQDMASHWSTTPYNKDYMLVVIPEYSDEYIQVKNKFMFRTPKHFKVTQINRIQNPYLLGCYLLKKHEMQVLFGDVDEKLVFHGTKLCNVEKICTNNFNWRLHGGSVGNRFGKGVSFTPKATYASHYSDKTQELKVMFLVRVLYHKAVQGNGSMELPPSVGYGNKRYDTAVKENHDVIVKFCDNEFYPQYIIHYTGSFDKSMSQNRKNGNFWDYDHLY